MSNLRADVIKPPEAHRSPSGLLPEIAGSEKEVPVEAYKDPGNDVPECVKPVRYSG